jgi:sugar O-acyltransferase (sialic acid O-acetyltransferase NeuD family)
VKSLLVIGAGALGREVAEYANATGFWRVEGFIDDGLEAGSFVGRHRVVGPVARTSLRFDAFVVCAVGDPRIRQSLLRRMELKVDLLAVIIHPSAVVSPSAIVGPGGIVGPFAFVGPNATLGRNCVLNTYASAGHDAVVGDHAVLSPYAALNGHAILGEGVFLGTRATVLPRITVGPGSKIAAGAVVAADLPPSSLAAGNPAKSRVLFQPWEAD